ncbi:hypothetical protein IW140_004947 [Coemansia sp. RSA 1813]|nr:hypothetical protein EV178_004922 [Coemansia sp. RSA 1646]KAJ1770062.1 hypothetical protein LPJ74_003503 [Coemansia sp. RSA 1843]KAJ2087436.1 hypothetical protein IW138_004974 [Coemansia sp. RSA 986]KAJ2212427.1 hypothetical protein EV179_004680 [Coemansia sp. RSA 487]KAJ2566404.1 hypothetical protein IW140_004947 [Coemansia sp. RSA 1813]
MSSGYTPKISFETPEGKWTLVSEFTTEEAANQFVPHIARDINGDDLCMGASGSECNPPPPPTPPANSGGLRFSAASVALATSGIMLTDTSGASMQSGSPSGLSSGAGASYAGSKASQHAHTAAAAVAANRPTHVSVFRTSGLDSAGKFPAGGVSDVGGASVAGLSGSNTSEQAASQPTSGKGLGFRQGLLHFAKGSNGSSAGANAGGQQPHGKGIVTKSTSAYVQRIVTNENLAKWIMSDSTQTTYFLFNAPRCMSLIGLQPEDNGETLARLDLTSNTPLCHDINQATRSENRLDIILGFVHGNIIWYEPISGKYVRLNKNSGYNPAIVCVRWIPNSDNLFIAGTSDGCVVIMDKTKDDFYVPVHAQASERVDSMDAFIVTASQKPRSNPVSFWKVGNKPITSIAFSPDGLHVAITSEDGALRVIDYLNEILEDVYLSYFGGLSCCAWSDDCKYIVAGGKDDMLTIWSYYDQTIVARCQGHESWVRDVAFDPMGHGEENTYRFMSVGEDARLLIWDFSLTALHRPRVPIHRAATRPGSSDHHNGNPGPSSNNISSNYNTSSSYIGPRLSSETHLHGRPDIDDTPSGVVHSRAPQESVAVLQPLMSEIIHDTVLCSLQFCQDLLVTACRRGIIKTWKRPAAFDFTSLL